MQSFVRLKDKMTGEEMFLLVTEIISVLQKHEDNGIPRHTRILMRTGVTFIVEEDAETVIDYINEI